MSRTARRRNVSATVAPRRRVEPVCTRRAARAAAGSGRLPTFPLPINVVPSMRPTIASLGAAALVALTAATPLAAQRETPRESPREQRDQPPRAPREGGVEPLVRILGATDLAPDRAVVGITLGEATARGIRVDEVAEGGPAAQAGIRAGDHLTAVGDASLRLDPADADDPVLRTTSERRLRRALARLEAGNELTLRVASGDAERTVRLRTVRADALEPARDDARGGATMERLFGTLGRDADRATIGLTLGSTGSTRDTLGAFVLSVAEDGPAERAGIHEGARIAMIDDVDLRVPAADVEDAAIASRRASRLEERLARVTAGDEVTLRVWDDGRYRDVRVRTAKASEVWRDGERGFPGADVLRLGPGGEAMLRALPGGARVFSFPDGARGRLEIVTPDGRWEGDRPAPRADSTWRRRPPPDSLSPRRRVQSAPRVRVWQDGAPRLRSLQRPWRPRDV